MRTGLPWLIFAQVVVTLALLGFAYSLTDAATQSIIVGAVIGNWFKEGTHIGQQVAENRAALAAKTGS